MGGGEGMGPVKKTALALGESLFDKELGKPLGQLIIICGRNKVLKSTLESHEWTIPVKVLDFTSRPCSMWSVWYTSYIHKIICWMIFLFA